MVDLIEDVKQRARLLQRSVQRGEPTGVARLRRLASFRAASDASICAAVQRRHCLGVLALELGFSGWPPARAALAGDEVDDRGCVMFRDNGGSFWNIWSARYEEARQLREDHGGYLLAYRRHFVIAEAPFVEFVGVDPNDPDWDRIGRDWVRPRDRSAWTRLTARAVEVRLREYCEQRTR